MKEEDLGQYITAAFIIVAILLLMTVVSISFINKVYSEEVGEIKKPCYDKFSNEIVGEGIECEKKVMCSKVFKFANDMDCKKFKEFN